MARILVIDDDANLRELIELLLRKAGHKVVLAKDGVEGIQLYRDNPAELVITDLFMPLKNGVETINELRRDFPALPIIAMSGRHDVADILSASHPLGAFRTLEKPFQGEDLLGAVDEALAGAFPPLGD